MEYRLFVLFIVLTLFSGSVWCRQNCVEYMVNDDSCICTWPGLTNHNLYVRVSSGTLKGRDTGDYYSYESIPYAEDPVGNLRFEAPQPYRRKWKNVFDATVRSKPCMQWNLFKGGDDLLDGVEDCLTLNIHKPKGRTPKGGKYPVMVFLHGGGFMFGDVKQHDPIYLMKTNKIIVVLVNYRLGPLGFLSTKDTVITGNYGLKDQQMALRWIQENIAAFGGNPNEVMLIGFSAGGASTHLQLLHVEGKHLMNAAVSFSGVALNPWIIQENALSDALKMSALLNCPQTKDTFAIKRCLKKKKAEDIVRAVRHFLNYGYNPFTTFGPVVEHRNAPHAFMTQHPRDIIKSGNFSHIPWIASYTAQDGALNAAELLLIDPKTGRKFIYTLNDNWNEYGPRNLFLVNTKDNPLKYANRLRKRFVGRENLTVDNYLKVQEMYTFSHFVDGIQESLKLHSRYRNDQVYGYIYDNPPDWSSGNFMSNRSDISFGTNHLDDLSLIFKIFIRPSMREDERVISKKFVNMLVGFVKTRKPKFGTCKFENSAGKSKLKFLRITRYSCETITPPHIVIK